MCAEPAWGEERGLQGGGGVSRSILYLLCIEMM